MCNACKRPTSNLDRRSFLLTSASAALVAATFTPQLLHAAAQYVTLPAPTAEDTCPVCGMFVAKYPYWIATVLFKDGHADHFDGPKDFFKYLHDMKKYARGRKREQITAMGVTGYYDAKRIDAANAIYVIGSDVLGPMGHELVPLVDEAEAKEFLADHKGLRFLSFDAVKPELLTKLDNGKFE
ncbi:MAG: nitrous oxide reductase accessory protein NosL [Alphaproteobacteria bacterium]